MDIHSISQSLVKADKAMDYVPYVSIVNNVIVLIAKIALAVFSHHFPSMYETIQENALVRHIIQEKSVIQCIGLAIPFLNILVALCCGSSESTRAAPKDNLSSSERPFPPLEGYTEQLRRSQEELAKRQQEMDADFQRQLEALNQSAAALNGRTAPSVEQTLSHAKEQMNQSTARMVRQNRQQTAKDKQDLEANCKQQLEKLDRRIAGLNDKIAACPDTDKGRTARRVFEKMKADAISLRETYNSSTRQSHQANGF
jgi:hypothetical protein